jgi:hypothetical protein
MQKTILYTLLAVIASGSVLTAEARSRRDRDDDWRDYDRRNRHERYDRSDRHHHRHHSHYRSHRTRTVYVIENRRPVRRVVYVHPSGYYYRVIGGRHHRIRDRYYTSYPSRYYYSNGRPRLGISVNF